MYSSGRATPIDSSAATVLYRELLHPREHRRFGLGAVVQLAPTKDSSRLPADFEISALSDPGARNPPFTFNRRVGPLYIPNRSVSDSSFPSFANGCSRNRRVGAVRPLLPERASQLMGLGRATYSSRANAIGCSMHACCVCHAAGASAWSVKPDRDRRTPSRCRRANPTRCARHHCCQRRGEMARSQ